MNRLEQLLIQILQRLSKGRRVILALSVVVVFITTYILILPAFTLEKDEAAKQGGIDIPGVESVSQESVDDGDVSSAEDSSQADKTSETPSTEANEAQTDDTDQETTDKVTSKKKASKTDTTSQDDIEQDVTETDPLTYEDEFYRITVEDKANVLPENTEIKVEEIIEEEDEESYKEYCDDSVQAINDDEKTPPVKSLKFARFYDIKLIADGEEIKVPEDAVSVRIEYDDELAESMNVDNPESLRIVHFAENQETGEIEPEVLDSKTVEVNTDKKDNLTDTTFEAESFSVYGVIYTVDFHWEVDGKKFDFSIPGGGFISLQDLIEAIGISNTDKETKAFVSTVDNVEFSSPELMSVSKVEEETTVGSIKDDLNLECEYSDEITEDQIDEINAQKVDAGDWALISLKAFNTEETLTITMKNGDQFVVEVSDALHVLPDELVGKEIVIFDKTENRALTSVWEQNQYRTEFKSISYNGEGSPTPNNAHWIVEGGNGNYYLKSLDGKYLKIDNTNVSLVSSQSEATVLTIERGGNPDYRIYAQNDDGKRLVYCDNSNNDGFFSAPGGANNGNSRQWLGIDYAVSAGGDWMLYFDDDFDEITVHVGETITLRPYNKWEWKEGNVDVQTAHWNVGGSAWSNWSISSSDGTGDKYSTTTDGPFKFTRFVKEDDQLNTHYWSVQGLATQTGVYYLTNTKDTTKRIKVNVVEGDPVNKPNTINKIANIKVNLFDYDKNGLLDPANDSNLANNSNNKSDSVNKMGDSNHFYFLSSGSGNNNSESWNNYTKDAANPNIVKNALGTDGYPELDHGNSNTSLKYLFDTSKTTWNGGNNNDGMIAYPNVVGMFQKDNKGYYYFNSNTNYFYYDTATGTSKLYEHTYTQVSKSDGRVNDKPIGFFPFHDYDATDDLYVNQNSDLNHHLGLSMELEFMLPRDRKDDNNEDIVFDFSGDDDLWVFVEWEDDNGQKHSKLLLDLGGVHQPIHGDINFTDGENTAFMETNRPYTLKVFYLERGGCDSNCSIRFNLPIVQDLTVAKKLTGLTEDEKAKYSNEEFTYEVLVNGQPYNYPNPANRYEKAIIRNAAGEDVTPANFKIENGRFKLKDGHTLTITYLDRSDTFSVSELNTSNMANFETPNAERYYHQEHDASLYEEEIGLTASQTVSEPHTDCWTTPTNPPYDLEDTEKVTFTNTLKEKNLEVEKKWVGEQTHPESITFKVIATIDDGNGGRIPYAVKELKEDDGTTDKTFTLSDVNKWRYEIEHLPVNTPGTPETSEGKFIFYDIVEGQVDGYVLTGSEDITADKYNYCNVDVVKLWPDSNGEHTEILRIALQNPAGEYYAGVNNNGEAVFSADPEDKKVYELRPNNNYTHRFARVPALPEGQKYTAVQLSEDDYSEGLALYVRDIIQYELENTPLENPVDPADKPNEPVIHKRIDALRDGVANPDSAYPNEDLTDLYRLYLDYKINALQDPNGVDLLLVIDHSGSMNSSEWPGNEYRAPSVESVLNGQNGLISKFLAANDKNQWAAVGFKGPDGSKDYEWSLKNPWQPSTDQARNNAGQNGSEILSSGSTFSRSSASIDLDDDEGASVLSNYTAGFWRAEQFLTDSDVKTDGRKKVVIFITDGVPTLHIDNLNNSLQNAGTAAGSPYYREEYGGCPGKALTEFGYFVNDMTNNGYSFVGDNSNIEFYTIGLGASMQTDVGSNLLNEMLGVAYGQNVPANHFMTIADASGNNDSSTANKLSEDLRIILGLNHTYSNLVIQDDLSKYVDLYGLANAGSSDSDIMIAAKAKVTMAVPDPEHPENPPQVITLYENGAPVDSDAAKFTRADGTTKANIIQRLEYNAASKTVSAVFDPEYKPAGDVTYTLSFDVKATDTAYSTYADSGYDKYTSGDKQGQVITGDEDTDFLGTNPANATSVDKPGFRSNDEAKATYDHNGTDEELVYPHPVIQVAAKADIIKIDQDGNALEGAKFNLYDDEYDPDKTIEENAEHLVEADLQSKKPTDPAGDDAVIRSGKLLPGTYYLVETEAPGGYNSLPGPVKITVTETNGVLNMSAEIAGEYVGDDKLVKTENYGVWKLSVQNTAGYELPSAGGPGTTLFYVLGSLLVIAGGIYFAARRRLMNH